MQRSKSSPSPQIPQTDVIDEMFYLKVAERAKKAEQERREIARRARDNYHRNSAQINVCFDTDNHATVVLQPPPLNTSDKINRESENGKQIQIEVTSKESRDQDDQLLIKDTEHQRSSVTNSHILFTSVSSHIYSSKPILPLTREDIRQWFCTIEIPYSTFRSPKGDIYPWFHGKHFFVGLNII